MTLFAVFIVLVFLLGLISRPLERTVLTPPMLCTGAGLLTAAAGFGLEGDELARENLLRLAELGLVLLLFADASRTDLGVLRHIRNLPTRLLSTGMLLTLVLGAVGAWACFPSLSLYEAGILAAILAPTDAGLGQMIVSSPRVPQKLRQALNVEAGLNDGLAVPFLLFFMGFAGHAAEGDRAGLTRFILEQLGVGTLVGLSIGWVGGGLLGFAHRRQWMAHAGARLGVVVLPLLCAVASELLGASMFIAAFVAGLAVQVGFKEAGAQSVEFTEEWGQLLNLAVFFLFGLLVAPAVNRFDWPHLGYALLSLTVVRMVPVAVALRGTRLSRPTVLFLGWFGPRGLASIVLGLVYLEEALPQSGSTTIRLAVMLTVLLSIFAHGMSTQPGIALYARKLQQLPPGAPELDEPSQAVTRAPNSDSVNLDSNPHS